MLFEKYAGRRRKILLSRLSYQSFHFGKSLLIFSAHIVTSAPKSLLKTCVLDTLWTEKFETQNWKIQKMYTNLVSVGGTIPWKVLLQNFISWLAISGVLRELIFRKFLRPQNFERVHERRYQLYLFSSEWANEIKSFFFFWNLLNELLELNVARSIFNKLFFANEIDVQSKDLSTTFLEYNDSIWSQ